MEPILSVLIISYNQRELLRRCLDSVVSQKINVPYEIIVSDALSTDGTWDLIEEYNKKFPQIVYGVHCNTDEGGALNRTECCGWMKLTAYKNARGKYFVNIDADDYLLSDDIYQKQIDLLESHPECSMCQQRVWQVKDGEPTEQGFYWPSAEGLTTGSILTPLDIIVKGLRGLNQSYMIRRHPHLDVVGLYGKHFDDTIITLHHLQFGNVVFLDRADYVWVQYGKSINSSLKSVDREVVIGLLPIHHILFIPTFAGLFMKDGLRDLVHLFKQSSYKTIILTSDTIKFLNQFQGFLFRYYTTSHLSLWYKFRMMMVRYLALLIKKYRLDYAWAYNVLFAMMVDAKSAHKITKEQWTINP